MICEDTICCERDFSRGRMSTGSEDIETGQQLEIQDGGLKSKQATVQNAAKAQINENDSKMWSKEDIEALDREEDDLICRILRKMRVEAIKTRREERKNMLVRLLGEETEETKSLTCEEINKLAREENEKTKKISINLFKTLAAENMQRTFYDKSILNDENGVPQHEVTSIVAIRSLKDRDAEAKPIYVSLSFRNSQMLRNVGYIADDIAINQNEEIPSEEKTTETCEKETQEDVKEVKEKDGNNNNKDKKEKKKSNLKLLPILRSNRQ